MNRIYSVVWSRARACYVVVSEYARRHTKSGQTKKLLAAFFAAAAVGTQGAFAAEMPGTYTYKVWNTSGNQYVTYTCTLVAQDGLTGYYRDSSSDSQDKTIYYVVKYTDDTYEKIASTNTTAVSIMPDTHTSEDGTTYYLKNNTLGGLLLHGRWKEIRSNSLCRSEFL